MATGELVETERERNARRAALGWRQKQLVEELLSNNEVQYGYFYGGYSRFGGFSYGEGRLPAASWRPLLRRMQANGFRLFICRTRRVYRMEYVPDVTQGNP